VATVKKLRSNGYLKPALMLLLSVPVVYLLSFGPVEWVWLKLRLHKRAAPDRIRHILYKPLEDLYHANFAGGRWYKYYVNFWINLDAP
jgi:hypothetical protein